MKKSEYKTKNNVFWAETALKEDICKLPQGILYRVIKKGEGTQHPTSQSIVSVHYSGKLIDGRIFDSTLNRGYPEAFRLNQVITGWQIALSYMCVGDKWEIIIPQEMGYGKKSIAGIPGYSVLIFEVELLGIA